MKFLIAKEIRQCEKNLCACALEVEKDEKLNEEMEAWDATMDDGLDGSENESW